MSAVVSRKTNRAYNAHVFARESYLNKLGVEAHEADFGEGDLMHARLRYSLSLLHQRAFKRRLVLRCLVFSLIGVTLFAGMAMLAGLHHQFPAQVMAILLGLGIAPLATAVTTAPVARSSMRTWQQMVEEVQMTREAFNDSVAEDLDAVGIRVQQEHSLGRYVTDRGVVALVTVDGDLEMLLNGRLLRTSSA